MILIFFDPPSLSADVIISYTHLKDDIIIFSYTPTHPPSYRVFSSLINKVKIRQGLFLLKKNTYYTVILVHFSRKKIQSLELNLSVISSKG
jgi:hypothetical protein